MDQATRSVREAERKFLKWGWWVFPLAGIVLAMLTGGGFWAWVDGQMPWLDWRQACTLRGAVMAVAGMMLALLWRMLLWRDWPAWVLALSGVLGFVCAEYAMRISPAQTAFWLATRARLDVQGPNFMSEVCYIRLEEAAGRTAKNGAVILSGTSQMLCGVDELELRRLLDPVPVIRREVSGMVPQKMLAAWSWIPFRRGDRSVQMRSEMDFTNQTQWRTAWYRPFLTWQTLPWLVRNAGGRVCWQRWRELLDCALAASLEGWRMRDGWREIAMNPWRRVNGGAVAQPDKSDVVATEAPLEWCEWEWQAFVEEAEHLKDMGVELVVVEGDVNPVLHDARRAEMRREFERRMTTGVEQGLWKFVGEEELGAGIEAKDWKDMTHVNATGRVKLTKAIARVFEPFGNSCK